MDKSIEINTVPQNAALHSVSAEIPPIKGAIPMPSAWKLAYIPTLLPNFASGFRSANPESKSGVMNALAIP